MSESRDRLDAIYARLPHIECKGLCHEACGPIGMTRIEHRRLEEGRGPLACKDLVCPLLDENKRCTAYSIRPLVCRLFGLVEQMRCPHGCEPERWLSDEEATEIMRQVIVAGGPPRWIL